MERIVIRRAVVSDIDKICKLIEKYSKEEALLPRSLEELVDMLPNFLAADYCGQFAGCVAFKIDEDFQAEIVSWVVDKQYHNHGIGGALITSVMERIEDLGIKSAIALTVHPGTFEKHGFKEVSKDSLSRKILADCVRCPLNHAVPGSVECKEIALLKNY